MPVQLKTSPYLNRAKRAATAYVAISTSILLITLAILWGGNYARSYMEAPVVFNIISTTKQNMRYTLRWLIIATPILAILFIPAGINFIRHVKSRSVLTRAKRSRYSPALTQTQLREIDRLASEILDDTFSTGSHSVSQNIRDNIWAVIKTGVIMDIQDAAETDKIDLEVLVKQNIANSISLGR